MNEQKVMVIDIEPKTINATEKQREQESLWARSDNSFKFNFLQENCSETSNQASSSENKTSHFVFTEQKESQFAFNFQIDPQMDMDVEALNTKCLDQCPAPEASLSQQNGSSSNTSASNVSKRKKKKTGKNKDRNGNSKTELKDTAAEGEREDAELSTEEQLQRQLDWCIEQLELGMRSNKASPKQKEEASRALKTLSSSKAPLVKKRQVMRAMAGDYRKKMEEEKSRQHKLIQNETASAQLRAVSELPKKSSFHRRAVIKSPASESTSDHSGSGASASDKNFVFTPSNDKFCFNFL